MSDGVVYRREMDVSLVHILYNHITLRYDTFDGWHFICQRKDNTREVFRIANDDTPSGRLELLDVFQSLIAEAIEIEKNRVEDPLVTNGYYDQYEFNKEKSND